jgi:hypothetical protein
MYNVEPKYQRTVQPAVFNGNVLCLAYFIGTSDTEYATHLPFPYFIVNVFANYGTGYCSTGRNEIELADFFVNGHFRHQRTDVLIHFILGKGGLGKCEEEKGECYAHAQSLS